MILAAIGLVVVTSAQAVVALPYSGLYVFVDSLSDGGNAAVAGFYDPSQVITGNTYVPSKAYAPFGTFSNGPVWASLYASALGLPLTPSFIGSQVAQALNGALATRLASEVGVRTFDVYGLMTNVAANPGAGAARRRKLVG